MRTDHSLNRDDVELFDELESLGISHAYCFRVQGTGQIQIGMPGIGGAVDVQGGTLPEWVSEFLRSPQREDVLAKLEKSRAAERHVFVLVEFRGAPWSVASYLAGEIDHLPAAEPALPRQVTGVWIASRLGTKGVRWDRAGWRSFGI